MTVATPDKILAQNSYRYDGNGQRIEKNERTGQTLYTYDKLNRLQQAEYPTDTERFTYDNASNRLTRTAKDIEEQYIYDVNNRLTSQIVNGRGKPIAMMMLATCSETLRTPTNMTPSAEPAK